MRLRYATPGDAEAIGTYHHRCWVEGLAELLPPDAELVVGDRIERWQRILAGPAATTTVVAEVDGVPIGHTTVSDVELVNLFVDPDHWATGTGRALLAVGERLLARAGCELAFLYTVRGNQRAVDFYRAAGWEVDGTERVEQMFGIELDEIRLSKRLETEPLARNRGYWDAEAPSYVDAGRRAWAGEPSWGIFGVPDSDVGVMPEVAAKDVVELGCGTAYVSAWCLRVGARSVVGLDNSPAQLATARSLQAERGLSFPLVWGDAEASPFTADSFDVAISEYGAAIWCDPQRWIPEAARILRPGGLLVFLGNAVLMMLCAPDFENESATAELRRPQRAMHQFLWPDTSGVEYHISHGDMIRILRGSGFEVMDLIELYAPVEATTRYDFVDAVWASQWPCEEIWIARLS